MKLPSLDTISVPYFSSPAMSKVAPLAILILLPSWISGIDFIDEIHLEETTTSPLTSVNK